MKGNSTCRECRPPQGVVLLLVTGLLVLISLVAFFFVQVGHMSLEWSKTRLFQGDAARVALDGLEYAAARLRQVPDAVLAADRTAWNACDDWGFRDDALAWRDGVSLAASTGPSYLRGEPWVDTTGVVAGVFEPGVESWTEVDGDGRFSAYSGRLRGEEPFSRRFSLRIRPSQICVNGGELGLPAGDHDMDGILNESDPDYDLVKNYRSVDGVLVIDPQAILNWQDPDFFPNTPLVNILNNLGSVLMEQGILSLPTHMETVYDANPAYGAGSGRDVVIELSDLGRIIVGNRPRGGYSSIEDLWPHLENAGLTRAEFYRLTPFLTTVGEIVPVGVGQPRAMAPFPVYVKNLEKWIEFHARLDLNNAPREVIKAWLLHQAASACWESQAGSQFTKFAWIVLDRANGIDDAQVLTDAILAGRPFDSWRSFLKKVDDTPLSVDAWASGRQEAKNLIGDLVLANADANGSYPDPFAWSKSCLDLKRNLEAPRQGNDKTAMRQLYRSLFHHMFSTSVFMSVDGPYDQRGAPAVTLASASPIFSVESEGYVRQRQGGAPALSRLRMNLATKEILLTSQQDFERLPPSLDPAAADVWRHFGGEVRTEGARQERLRIQSHPRFPLTGPSALGVPAAFNYTPVSIDPMPPVDPAILAEYTYSSSFGDLRLSARQKPDAELMLPCVFALPFNEDIVGNPYYSPASYLDNVADPVPRPCPPVVSLNVPDPARAADPLPVGWGKFHKGIQYSPCGPRCIAEPGPGGSYEHLIFTWDGPGCFPLLRADDLRESPPVPLGGEILQGAIEFWIAQRAGELAIHSTEENVDSKIVFQYKTLQGSAEVWVDYFTITISYKLPVFGVQGEFPTVPVGKFLWNSGVKEKMFIESATGQTTSGRPSWRHIVVSFSEDATDPLKFRGDGKSLATLYIDGQDPKAPVDFAPELTKNPFPMEMDTHRSHDIPGIRMLVSGGFIDDIRLFENSLDAAAATLLASEPRYEPRGDYISPRYIFDEVRFPQGVELRGAAWDAFMPGDLTGEIRYTVTARRIDGSTDTRTFSWDKTGSPHTFFASPITQVRSAEIKVEMEVTASSCTLKSTGMTVLRDTPVLDEFRLIYGEPHSMRRSYAAW